MPNTPHPKLDVLLPRIEPLTARQIELAEHSNVKRMLLGVYNATNRVNEIVAEYEAGQEVLPVAKKTEP